VCRLSQTVSLCLTHSVGSAYIHKLLLLYSIYIKIESYGAQSTRFHVLGSITLMEALSRCFQVIHIYLLNGPLRLTLSEALASVISINT
jgi:hypothetical protein